MNTKALPAPGTPVVIPEGFTLEIDIDELTLGEIDTFEELSGMSFGQLGMALNTREAHIGKVMRALALVQLRRTQPHAEWEDTAGIKLPKVGASSTAEEADPLESAPPA